jgi:hypothetical protein
VLVDTAARRNTTSWLHFLDELEHFVPPGQVYVILDGLALHWSIATMLWNGATHVSTSFRCRSMPPG